MPNFLQQRTNPFNRWSIKFKPGRCLIKPEIGGGAWIPQMHKDTNGHMRTETEDKDAKIY